MLRRIAACAPRIVCRAFGIGVSCIAALLVFGPPSTSAAPNRALCEFSEQRVAVPADFALDACFDGTTLVIVNPLDIPVEVQISGRTIGPTERSSYGPPEPASLALDRLLPSTSGILMPRYRLRVSVGAGSAEVRIGGTELGPAYAFMTLAADVIPAPELLEIAALVPPLTAELKRAIDNRVECERKASNWYSLGSCKARFLWDVDFALTRFGVKAGAEAFTTTLGRQLVVGLVELAFKTDKAAQSGVKFSRSPKSFRIAAATADAENSRADVRGYIVQWSGDQKAQKTAWLVGQDGRRRWIPSSDVYACLQAKGVPGPVVLPSATLDRYPDLVGVRATCGTPPRPSPPTTPRERGSAPPPQPALPITPAAPAPTLTISGSCTSESGTLEGASAGFTPGGIAAIEAWHPDGRPYTAIITTSRVRSDGSIHWSWPCAGDAPGVYATEARDLSSGQATGRVQFSVGAPPMVPPPNAPVEERAREVVLIVWNKVTNGPRGLAEDRPAYLSTRPQNYCLRDGCAVADTDRGTGGTYAPAVCQVLAARTTNGNDRDPADDINPDLFTSERWYGVLMTDASIAYISEVWIDPSQRGGLGLPGC
jgi:hypothetical protein